ncbi:UDP-N-acetylmuramoyl-L-alanyl-D-glutamate--2,6-diaminopimelate ligase [Fangia hongkongensis]|uniref:UDP-N-acetylmuramoyl-L-alanyl-D-glutamate--2, 6-diaminopimelate ligase n=1 Tax=Fangia hongkongensis TaxID=270495 RepID=UPI0003661096|nr:UDP-N-acetylmuramoyl-L-alanyl-D-glutamate--2,6-diaminopimelate ligase [Fangia hongkongensis]MBK2125421.1 UDP-N-acetylmuramoyl-L-alanyl-D-glutamate--2,6-diaminopimelate ligase [Fangia hongkongensis]
MRKLSEIFQFFHQDFPKNHQDIVLHHLTQDSRLIAQNSIFIALKGEVYDGHQYVLDAFQNGALFAIVEDRNTLSQKIDQPYILELKTIKNELAAFAEWFYHYPSRALDIYAVTGTNGKSSIAHFIAGLFTTLEKKAAVLGTIGNGVYPLLQDSPLTTLDSIAINDWMAQFVKKEAYHLSLEASSHALDQRRLENIKIKTAIFTNLDVDHLDYHGSMDNYFYAKRSLFMMPSVEIAIINIDDDYGQKLYRLLDKKKLTCFSYSIENKSADCFFEIVETIQLKHKVKVYWQKRYIGICLLSIPGKYNVSNIAASFAAMMANGYELAVEKLEQLKSAKGRVELLEYRSKAAVVIDYAHTPDALENVLIALKERLSGKLICLFGCGGDRETSKREKMAMVAKRYADVCIVTEDNSRTEPFNSIVKDIQKGFSLDDHYTVIEEREKAIYHALEIAESEDVVLLAGKGHETYLDKNNKRHYFDEREIVKAYYSRGDSSL